MNETVSFAAATSDLARAFSGIIVTPADDGYETARRVHNGLVDKRPAVIARCLGVADVIDAIRFARHQGLGIAVKGGGHNVAGRATIDGGLMLDLSLMRGVRVDPASRIARAQGGATWHGFNRETQLHGLATTGGAVSSTGVAGLTLGGGLGWLMGKHGLSLDNLLSVDLVLPDGRAVTASDRIHPDLFWAVRGGGGNFGVATSFEFRLHAIGPTVTGGLIAYPFESAWDVLRHYRDLTAALPDELSLFAALVHAPDGSGVKLAAILACHCGSIADGAAAMHPLKSFGQPAMDALGPMPYSDLNTMLDGGYPAGALNYWKSSFMSAISDDALRGLIDCFARCPGPMGAILIEHLHGAVTRVDPTATAFPHRRTGYNMAVLGNWANPADTASCIAWTRESYATLQVHADVARYVNYLGDDESADAVAAAYGPNYRRLQQVKAVYDPQNVFRMNQNIQPLA